MFLSIAQKRRSTRKFLKKPVETEKIEQLIESALYSPSSRGSTPWEFVVVTDPALLETLSGARPSGSTFLKNAPVGIVICADSSKSDVWVEDCSIANTLIQLAAVSLGLGSCWIQVRERMHASGKTAEAFISEVLALPPNLRVGSMVAVGYPDESKPPKKKEELPFEKAHLNRFGRSFR